MIDVIDEVFSFYILIIHILRCRRRRRFLLLLLFLFRSKNEINSTKSNLFDLNFFIFFFFLCVTIPSLFLLLL